MKIGIPKETRAGETRVAATPETVRKLHRRGAQLLVESGAGAAAHFADQEFEQAGAQIVGVADALGADVVCRVQRPDTGEIAQMRRGAVLIAPLELCRDEGTLDRLADAGVSALALERMPRITRAQSMDTLSSQTNIAGYRAMIEAARLYCRFLPMMMTAAGSSRPAKVVVLGAGVAGLQAIATARRLGAEVRAYDVRPEVREQIESLGAKFLDVDVGESGAGTGGYAKELSEEGKRRQQEALAAHLKGADIIVSTALIPCKPAPVLIPQPAVEGMRDGSVIIDMAAANGGNCPLSRPDEVIVHQGVTIVGYTNYPAMVAGDASSFYARNLLNLLELILEGEGGTLKDLRQDEITAAMLVTDKGEVLYRP